MLCSYWFSIGNDQVTDTEMQQEGNGDGSDNDSAAFEQPLGRNQKVTKKNAAKKNVGKKRSRGKNQIYKHLACEKTLQAINNNYSFLLFGAYRFRFRRQRPEREEASSQEVCSGASLKQRV